VALVSGFVLGGRNGYLQPEGLRGPAPRGYNGDDSVCSEHVRTVAEYQAA
jgi:hypothetical protein